MKPRVLYITHRVPWPPDRGDRIRTWNILKYLAARAHVDLICLADEPVSDATRSALEGVTERLAIVPHAGKLRYVRGAISMLRGRTVTEGLFDSHVLTSVVRQWASQPGTPRHWRRRLVLPAICKHRHSRVFAMHGWI